MSQRAFYSINGEVLSCFNRSVPARERSKVVESLMCQHLEQHDEAIIQAARHIEADESYHEIGTESEEMSFETQARLERNDVPPFGCR